MTAQVAAAHPLTHPRPEEGLGRGMAGMVLFIASEVMLFGGLFAGYFFVRQQAGTWPPEGVHDVDFWTGLALTVLLVTSGLVAHFGTVAIKANNNQGLVLGLGVAILMGTVFICAQAYEWFNLMDEGLTAKSGPYGATFYVLTGFHGAHVIVGLALLAVCFVRALSNDFTSRRHVLVDASALYWHFVDFVWVLLFLVLYIKY